MRVGETGQFETEFRGVPAPRPTWLVSGTEITQTDKYHIEIAECVTRLSVAETTAEDATMTYTCRLTSAAGQTESTARFVIQGIITFSTQNQSISFPYNQNFLLRIRM